MNFLVDANLPRNLTQFNSGAFHFVIDWGEGFPDRFIWDYAIKNDLIILTRDSDYFYWIIQAKVAPKVVYLKLQQLGRKELDEYFSLYWEEICALIEKHRMVIANINYLDVF